MRWWSRKAEQHNVRLYGKPGCHLCEDARALLDAIGQTQPLSVEEVDITRDPRLFRAYDIRIPVFVVDDVVEIDAPISELQIRQALRDATRLQTGARPSRSR